jgi:pSer/pThr/pTyr-binding forkhead associated (FHA) protein
MWKLSIEDDEGIRTLVPLTRSEYTVGRREGSSIRLTERNVSRSHARIYRAEDGAGANDRFVLEDLTSYNGVFVNGLRIAHAQRIEHGDLLQIGDYRIVAQDDSVADVATPAPGSKEATTQRMTRASTLLDRPNRLVMLQGPTPGIEFSLNRERLTLGRAEDMDISIPHNSVSRFHCEIHALGDSRFELVDKGSSNGVRVNGSDLSRGIMESGDTIELGDVKLRYVGAGQIFRSDTSRFSVIADRPPAASRTDRIANGLPVAVFVLVALSGATGAWYYARRSAAMRVLPAPADAAEEAAVREARRSCRHDDCEAAHERLQSEVPPSSRWRESQEFKDVERQWADGLLDRASREPDVAAKRGLYQRVAQTPSVAPDTRRAAADRLQDLDNR